MGRTCVETTALKEYRFDLPSEAQAGLIKRIDIQKFRAIATGSLMDLTPLVVLVGPNGCGKSSVLDALLVGAAEHIQPAVMTVVERQDKVIAGYPRQGGADFDYPNRRWLIHRGTNDAAIIDIYAEPEASRRVRMVIDNSRNFQVSQEKVPLSRSEPPLATKLTSSVRLIDSSHPDINASLEELYSRAVKGGLGREAKDRLLEVLAPAEDIQILSEMERPVLHIVFPGNPGFAHPAALLGEGLKLYLRQSLELTDRPNSLILIEEPETHLNPGIMRYSAKAIWAAVRRTTQVILATHSLEFMDILLEESNANELRDMLSLFRLELREGVLSTCRLSGDQVQAARETLAEDLR